MVYFSTSEEWQRQSVLLLQARPTTTRITTKYKIPNLASTKYWKKSQTKRKHGRDGGEEEGQHDDEKPSGDTPRTTVPRAVLVLKTFDPDSGVCLKFKTDRAAEVGRLITGLGRLGGHMAALPLGRKDDDVAMNETAGKGEEQPGTNAELSFSAAPAIETKSQGPQGNDSIAPTPSVGSGGGGGGKKKKKNKK